MSTAEVCVHSCVYLKCNPFNVDRQGLAVKALSYHTKRYVSMSRRWTHLAPHFAQFFNMYYCMRWTIAPFSMSTYRVYFSFRPFNPLDVKYINNFLSHRWNYRSIMKIQRNNNYLQWILCQQSSIIRQINERLSCYQFHCAFACFLYSAHFDIYMS